MRTLLVSALALGAFTSAAFAEPLVLSDVQLDALTAGQDVSQTNSSEVNTTVSQSNSNTGLHREKLKGLSPGFPPGETRLRRESSSGKRCSQVRVNTITFGECQS